MILSGFLLSAPGTRSYGGSWVDTSTPALPHCRGKEAACLPTVPEGGLLPGGNAEHRARPWECTGSAPAASATSSVPGTGAAGGQKPKQAPGKPDLGKSQQPGERKRRSEHGTCGDVLLSALLWALKGALREDLQCLSSRPERSFQLSGVVAFGG